jgi:hypothetical protein
MPTRPAAKVVGKSVLNRTATLLPEWDYPLMSSNKAKKKSYRAVLASVKQEMAKPRVAESAQVETDRQRSATVKEAAKT